MLQYTYNLEMIYDMKKITYVTGNWSKVLSAKQILEPLGFEVNNIKLILPKYKQIQ